MSEVAAAATAAESAKRKESESETPSEKKRRTEVAALPDQTRPPKSDILGADGTWWALGGLRFARASEYKGHPFIDIREFYTDAAGELKPGKKGLALKPDQFAALLAFGESIQAATAAAATVKK